MNPRHVTPTDHAIAVGLRVRQLREAVGLTQTDVGTALGISASTVSRIEDGHGQSSSRLQQVADFFEVRLREVTDPETKTTQPSRQEVEFHVLRAPQSAAELSALIRITLPPDREETDEEFHDGYLPAVHAHEDEVLVLDGTLSVYLTRSTWTVMTGERCRIPAGVPHRFENDSPQRSVQFLLWTHPTTSAPRAHLFDDESVTFGPYAVRDRLDLDGFWTWAVQAMNAAISEQPGKK